MKVLILFLSIIFLYISNLNAQLYQNWKWLHQSPQGNELRWVKMWDANIIYAIGAKGTFIKTTDRGLNWTVQHKAGRMSGIPLQRADLRNAYFFNQNTGIVVGTYGSIFRTTDSGITFDSVPGNPIPPSTTITGISFINNLTGYIVAGLTNYRLMKTTDGGLNWNATPGTPPFSNPFDVYAFNESKILVLNSLGDVCITTNGGVLWNTYAIGSQVNFYKAVFTDANTGYACGDWGRCRYTTNGGFSWSNMSGALFDRPIHSFDLKVRNNAVYMTGNSGYIWRSTNLGVTWDSIEFIPASSPVVWSNSYYSSDFSITGDTIVTVGAHGSIYQTFSPANRIMLSQYFKSGNLQDVWASPASDLLLAIGAPSSASPPTHDQILRSSNGGINWNVISPSPTSTAEFYSIKMIDANTGYICGSKSAVYKTINGGANWDSVIIPNMPQNLILSKVDFVNAQTGWIFSKYLTGTDTTIFKTTNGGINWFKQKIGTATGSENTINAACMLDENNGWLLNNKPRPWKTTNGGASWDSTALGDNYLAGALYDIKMLNMMTGYCVGSNNRVYKTTNGGATPWSNVSFSSTTIITLYTCEVINPLECLVMGTYGTAYYTSNGGASWVNINLGASIDDIRGSYMTQDGKVYAVSLLNSCIFKNSNIFSVGIGNQNQENPTEYKLMQNYPNPFNPETTIKFTLPKASEVSLIIYDVSGREVKRLIDNVTMGAGTATKTFSANNLSSGIYFCSLIINGKNLTSVKMIILK